MQISLGAQILSTKMSKKYELMMIFSPELIEKEVLSEVEKIKNNIEALEGKITFEDFWGKRNLAYVIKKYDSGYYFVLDFDLNPLKIEEFEKDILLKKNIIRYLLIVKPIYVESKKYSETKKHNTKEADKPIKKTSKIASEESNEEVDVDKAMLDEKLEKILGNDLDI